MKKSMKLPTFQNQWNGGKLNQKPVQVPVSKVIIQKMRREVSPIDCEYSVYFEPEKNKVLTDCEMILEIVIC